MEPVTSVLTVSATTTHNTKMLFCDCHDPTLLVMGVAHENRIYLHCPRKDPINGWQNGCKFFAWMDDFALKNNLFKTPILVSVRPSFWQKIQVKTLDDVSISLKATIGKDKNKGSSKDLILNRTSKVDQSRDILALIEMINKILQTPPQEMDLTTILGSIRIMKRALRTLAEDMNIMAILQTITS
ncbi:hypothetical protein O181_023139 [Austropuccinia psidii MF-1]|uniref:Uncharacterized protein n=1 Tax=Austropuccinia psidii MF-1 TaxID=1389203 RepID=A0A9Q3CG38_9BASI|nr:hypothetical protein [Austropuccinia psidii MF-1]